MCNTILEVINNHREEIRNYVQPPINWHRLFTDIDGRNIPDNVRTIMRILPELLDRNQLFNYFENNELFYGFIATLVWGNGKRNFSRAVINCQEDVEIKLASVRDSLENDNLYQAYVSLTNYQNNHLQSVGKSFFTKLLYFMSRNLNFINTPKPLIWDLKMRYMHCAIIYEQDDNIVTNYYCNNHGIFDFATTNHYGLYLDYLERMNNFDLPADKLEAYLFQSYYCMAKHEVIDALGLARICDR